MGEFICSPSCNYEVPHVINFTRFSLSFRYFICARGEPWNEATRGLGGDHILYAITKLPASYLWPPLSPHMVYYYTPWYKILLQNWIQLTKWHKMYGWCESIVVSFPFSLVGVWRFNPYTCLFSFRKVLWVYQLLFLLVTMTEITSPENAEAT